MLAEACPAGMIRLGSEVITVTDHGGHVTVGLADGSTATVSVVVGADGAHSRLRALVEPGAASVYTGTSGFHGLAAIADLPSLSPFQPAVPAAQGPGCVGADAELASR
ncbi:MULTISPECIES: hypothetical protein [unclassified Pseudonocardia]|uniref:hypothetical protein n=1 Tax=unclassified Pseudonocardia TaxID=2619320 RepID=UPI0007617148|nr:MULTISPECIES: hypothetical protein [unclassified Pseudonocardia]ANY10717.1 hypothetical protein AFB00_30395 [Pseudonocardia sp. HH130630-07]